MFHPTLTRFINDSILPLTSLDAAAFWKGFDDLINEFSSGTRDLLVRRLDLQTQIDSWHDANPSFSQTDYEQFLLSIGYLLHEIPDFVINTDQVDAEIATL